MLALLFTQAGSMHALALLVADTVIIAVVLVFTSAVIASSPLAHLPAA